MPYIDRGLFALCKKKQASRNSQVFKIQLDKKKKISLEIRIQRAAYKNKNIFRIKLFALNKPKNVSLWLSKRTVIDVVTEKRTEKGMEGLNASSSLFILFIH